MVRPAGRVPGFSSTLRVGPGSSVPSFNSLPEDPERQGATCAPCSYGDGVGDGDGLACGGGVRRGFSVGVGVCCGVGAGDALGSGVGSGVATSVGLGVGVATSVGLGVGVATWVGSGGGAWVGPGVTTTIPGVGLAGRGDVVGATVCAGVGVTSGAMVAPPVNTGSCATSWEAAKTNAAPSSATVTIVRTRVPVVRIAPRRTWVRRSASQERCSWRRRWSARAARMTR